MATIVNTKAELKAALKRKDKEIIIEDEKLGKKVVTFKKIKKLTKWTLVVILGASAGAIALIPVTGGASVFGLLPIATGTGGAVLTAEAIVAIVALGILGVGLLFALWMDYSMIVEAAGVKVTLHRK